MPLFKPELETCPVCESALNIGAQLQKKVIDEEVILAAVSNQNPFA